MGVTSSCKCQEEIEDLRILIGQNISLPHLIPIAIDRLKDQENSLISEEKRLKDSIATLANAHKIWREQSDLLNTNRQNLINF